MLTLTQGNYYSQEANAEYMSVHQFQSWRECAAREWAIQHGKWHTEVTEAMLVGSYVDAALTETAEVFKRFKTEHAADIYTGKKDPHPRAQFERADRMIARLRNDESAREFLTGETQRIIVAELGGVLWKGKIDVFKPGLGMFVDLKTADSFDWQWRSFIDPVTHDMRREKVPWHDKYWFQLGTYRRILLMNGFDCVPIILGVTKQDPPDIGAWTFNAKDRLDLEVESGLSHLGQIMAYKRGEAPCPRCESCDYCRQTKTLCIRPAEDYRSSRGRR